MLDELIRIREPDAAHIAEEDPHAGELVPGAVVGRQLTAGQPGLQHEQVQAGQHRLPPPLSLHHLN